MGAVAHSDVTDTLVSNEAEQAVLGGILYDQNRMIEVAAQLTPEDFGVSEHQTIYRVMLQLYQERIAPDVLAVATYLRDQGSLEGVGSWMYLGELQTSMFALQAPDYYISLITDYAVRRKMLHYGNEIATLSLDTSVDKDALVDRATDIIRQSTEHRTGDYTKLSDVVDDFMEHLDDGDGLIVPTGITDLDQLYLSGGFRGGQMITIAARTGMGKTALGAQIAHHVAVREQRPVGFISLEMSQRQILTRLISLQGRVNMHEMRTKLKHHAIDHDSAEYQELLTTAGELSNAPMWIIDPTNLNIGNLTARITQLHARHHIDLLIVDYLQLVRGQQGSEKRYLEVTEVSRGLKALALSLDIPVLALAQLSREVDRRGENAKPRLSDIRESGSIEQDSDIVIFIHREEVETNGMAAPRYPKASLLIEKHREGPSGSVELLWNPEITRFLNAALTGGS